MKKEIRERGTRGFTLIEMLVSVAIFTTVMVIALGALLSLSEADRKAEVLNSAINNLSFGMEGMSRSLRTGHSYHCGISGTASDPQDCGASTNYPYTSAQSYIAFMVTDGSVSGCVAGNNCTVSYCLGSTKTNSCSVGVSGTKCDTANGYTCSILRSVNGGSLLPLTAADISITNLGFYVIGSLRKSATGGDSVQPKVTILMSASIPITPTQSSSFNLQTSVVQRLYDL